MIKYILASASPRRKELLAHLGISYEVCPSRCEEVITQTVPAKVVEELSCQKACDVANQIDKETLGDTGKTVVIGADTVVAIEGRILGKPGSEAQAAEMLALLSGPMRCIPALRWPWLPGTGHKSTPSMSVPEWSLHL